MSDIIIGLTLIFCYWNSLPNWVVAANNITAFKIRLHKHWQHQYSIYDFQVQIDGTGSRSEVSRVNVVQFDIVGCLVEIWEAGKEAIHLPQYTLYVYVYV